MGITIFLVVPIGKVERIIIKSFFFRSDKKLNFPVRKSIKSKIFNIRKNYGWCDDNECKKYNKFCDQ